MKTLKYTIDFSKSEEVKVLEQIGQKKVFEKFVMDGINQLFKEGLDRKNLEHLCSILNSLDNTANDMICLEEPLFDFLKKCFLNDTIKYRTASTRLIVQYLDNFNNAGNS